MSIMPKGDMLALLNGLIVVLFAEVEPIEASVENAVWDAASTLIEKVSKAKYFIWHLIDLQHLCEPFRKMVTVETQQIISIAYVTFSLHCLSSTYR